MPSEICVCGNITRRETSVRIQLLVCRCLVPGSGKRQRGRWLAIECINERQYNDRKRFGLPLADEVEMSIFKEAFNPCHRTANQDGSKNGGS